MKTQQGPMQIFGSDSQRANMFLHDLQLCERERRKLRQQNMRLVEALQAIHYGFMDGSIKWAKPRQADTDPYHPANVLMSAALQKVNA